MYSKVEPMDTELVCLIEKMYYYGERDFLETADSATLAQIVKARRFAREYYLADYEDVEKREAILREIFGGNVILPGVTVRESSVIGVGSVVNRDIPANCVAAGPPTG